MLLFLRFLVCLGDILFRVIWFNFLAGDLLLLTIFLLIVVIVFYLLIFASLLMRACSNIFYSSEALLFPIVKTFWRAVWRSSSSFLASIRSSTEASALFRVKTCFIKVPRYLFGVFVVYCYSYSDFGL